MLDRPQIDYRVLSLEQDTHRRELFFAQEDASRFQVFSAIHKSLDFVDERFDFEKARAYLGRDVTRGEAACTVSHMEIFRSFLAQSSAPWLVICEDDVIFHERFCLIEDVLAQDYPEFELYVFSAFKGETFSTSHSHNVKYPMQFFPRRYAGLRIGRVFKNYMCMTAGYAIHRPMVEKIMAFYEQHKAYWLADDFACLIQIAGYSHNPLAHIKPRLVMENPMLQSNLEADRLAQSDRQKRSKKPWSTLFFYLKNGLLYPFKALLADFKGRLKA